MPVIKSAKKKLRKDKKITARNNNFKNALKKTLKEALKKPSETNVKKAVKIIDQATKKNIFHKNKAARLKSKLVKLTVKKTKQAEPKAPAKKVVKTASRVKTKK